MSATETAGSPAVSPSAFDPRLVHFFPGRRLGEPAPWVSRCGAKVADERNTSLPKDGVPYCVVCVELRNTEQTAG